MGDSYHCPYGADKYNVEWVRLKDFSEALETISHKDKLIADWRESVRKERAFQEKCYRNDCRGVETTEAKFWNVYFLGALRERLRDRLPSNLKVDLTAYPYNSDTILNFGHSKEPYYMEINNNGQLNLKANLESYNSFDEKQKIAKEAEHHYTSLMEQRFKPKLLRVTGSLKKSKTVMSFDIGLKKRDRIFLTYGSDEPRTLGLVTELVETFYRSSTPPLV